MTMSKCQKKKNYKKKDQDRLTDQMENIYRERMRSERCSERERI